MKKGKNKIKKIILIVIIVLIAILSPILYVVFGWTALFGGLLFFSPIQLPPYKTYGEFPFELTYELSGETITISDIYICEYDGMGWNEGQGWHRKWKGYIQGTGKEALFITEDDKREIYCFVGDAEFYMNDERYPEQRPLTPRLYCVDKNSNVDRLFKFEISTLYDIEIISWTFSDPLDPALINN